jgi:hypothetical protein
VPLLSDRFKTSSPIISYRAQPFATEPDSAPITVPALVSLPASDFG